MAGYPGELVDDQLLRCGLVVEFALCGKRALAYLPFLVRAFAVGVMCFLSPPRTPDLETRLNASDIKIAPNCWLTYYFVSSSQLYCDLYTNVLLSFYFQSRCVVSISKANMTDSPAVWPPLDPQEQPILDYLLRIRDSLLLIKQDKSTYIKSQDVLPFYDQAVEQVQLLNQVRGDRQVEQNRGTDSRLLPTGNSILRFVIWFLIFLQITVDNVLDDCFQLISLLFLTVGRNNDAPAV